MGSLSELSELIQVPSSMMQLLLCSLILVMRLEECSVNKGEVVSLVMVQNPVGASTC